MPWATNGVADDQAVDERPVVMAAFRADRKHLGPAAHQQHLFAVAMADQLAAIGKIGKRDALHQIRPGWLLIAVSHCTSPLAI